MNKKKELLVNGYIHDEIQTLLSDKWIIPKDISDICLQYSPDGEFFGQKGNNIDVNAAKNIAKGQMPKNSAHRVYGNVIIDFKETEAPRIDITWKFRINLSDGDLYIGLDKANNKRLNDDKIPGLGCFFTNACATLYGPSGVHCGGWLWDTDDVLEMTVSLNKKIHREYDTSVRKYLRKYYGWNDKCYHQVIMRSNGKWILHDPYIKDDGENSCYQLAIIMSGNHRVELLDFKILPIQELNQD